MFTINVTVWARLPDAVTHVNQIPPELGFGLVVGAFAFAGAGGVQNLVQSNWIRDKLAGKLLALHPSLSGIVPALLDRLVEALPTVHMYEEATVTAVRALKLAQKYEEHGNEAWVPRLFGQIAAKQRRPGSYRDWRRGHDVPRDGGNPLAPRGGG